MRNLLIIFALVSCLVSCQKNLDERAEKEAKDFTTKYCPTPEKNFERTDSMTYEKSSKTFIYWKTLSGNADDKQLLNKNKDKLHEAILEVVNNNTNLQLYKENGFTFRYVFHSASHPSEVLLDFSYGPKEYNNKRLP
ncbi:MAG: hypothetical protein ACOYJG_04690 [Prevotella sp.]|jgi:hypothetical protein